MTFTNKTLFIVGSTGVLDTEYLNLLTAERLTSSVT